MLLFLSIDKNKNYAISIIIENIHIYPRVILPYNQFVLILAVLVVELFINLLLLIVPHFISLFPTTIVDE